MNGVVVAFTLGVAPLTSLVFGLIPALSGLAPAGRTIGLKGSVARLDRRYPQSPVARGVRRLAICAFARAARRGWTSHSQLRRLRGVRPAPLPRGVVTFWQSLPQSRYPSDQKKIQYFQALLPKLHAIPGVTDVGMAAPLPFSDSDSSTSFGVVGHPDTAPGKRNLERPISPPVGSYFRTMRIPQKSVRTLDERIGRRAAGEPWSSRRS